MPAASPLRLLASAVCVGLLYLSPVRGEEIDIVIDDFSTGFTFTDLVKVGNNTTFDNTFIMRDYGSLTWTDSGTGIYNGGDRTVLIDNYADDGGSYGAWVTGEVLGNQINVGAQAGVRAQTSLSYDLDNISLLSTQYLTFDLDFDEQAAQTTRAQVTFTDGTESTTAELAFFNATTGLNNLDLNNLATDWDWDATTWTNINNNGLTGVTFTFYSTDFGDDFKFATQGFNATALGSTLTQTPEPTSMLMFGILMGGSIMGRRRVR